MDYSYDSRGDDRYEIEKQKFIEQGCTEEQAEMMANGWWQDPAGGWHPPGEDHDPAAMYK